MPVCGIGHDSVDIKRIRQAIARHPKRFIERLLTQREQGLYLQKGGDLAIYVAGRFAAKEALVKALGTGFRNGIDWLDLEIDYSPLGQPKAVLSPRLSTLFENPCLLISITHTHDYAAAVAIWEKPNFSHTVEPALHSTSLTRTSMFPFRRIPTPTPRAERISGGCFLILLALLFYTGAWWPGILFALAVSWTIKQILVQRKLKTLLGIGSLVLLAFISFSERSLSIAVPAVLILAGLYMIGNELRPIGEKSSETHE